RRSRHGLQPHRRQGQGEGLLRRRRRRVCVRRVHLGVPVEVRALELAQVPLWRELRHATLRGGGEPARGGPLDRPERRDPAVADSQLRPEPGPSDRQSRHRPALPDGAPQLRCPGPAPAPLSRRADYDPQSAALSSAYVSALNDYVRRELHYGDDRIFKPRIQTFRTWNFAHQQPGHSEPPLSARQGTNVMPDLANAMKLNPNLKVQLNAGYVDLATPFYQGVYEMHHLPIPQRLQANIEYCFYESGHMVYAKDASLRQLHDNVADFIRRTSNVTEQAR